MSLKVNLRHLEEHSLRLSGELSVRELELDPRDEAIRVGPPLRYELEAQKLEGGLLLQGRLRLPLECQCVRCLKVFRSAIELNEWTLLLPLEGEEAVAVTNDCVDLTAWLREDILLEFPQHPLCDPDCRGLPKPLPGKAKKASRAKPMDANASAWSELNKLKF